MISLLNIGFIAGILEGEGHFRLGGDGNKYPCILLEMTDKDTVEKVRDIINPPSKISAGWKGLSSKTTYRVGFYGTNAVSWMMTIYSLLSARRRQKIREILNVWKIHEARWKRQERLSPQAKRKNWYRALALKHAVPVGTIKRRLLEGTVKLS